MLRRTAAFTGVILLSVSQAVFGQQAAQESFSQTKRNVSPFSKAQSGWLVDVLPYDGRSLNTSQDALLQIVVPPTGFSLLSHSKILPVNNPTFYSGSAFINIPSAGRYIFYLGSNTDYSCTGSLSIDGRKIIEEKQIAQGSVVFGGADLDAGLLAAGFLMQCYLSKADVRIQIRPPGESAPRDLRADEVVFVRKR